MKGEKTVLSNEGEFDEDGLNRFFPTESYDDVLKMNTESWEEFRHPTLSDLLWLTRFRGMCVHHSQGHNSEFQQFVQDF